MSTVTIKDIPANLHASLKLRAESNGRSLNREIIMILETSVRGTVIDVTSVIDHARAVRETLDVYMTQPDLKQLKGAGRR